MNNRNKSLLIITIIVFIVFYCAYDIDYSSLNNFNINMFLEVIKGLFKPKWDYLYDGSGEDVISLVILTIGIAFMGTFIGTVLSIPFTLISSNNLWNKKSLIPKLGKFVLDILRSFPELIYAIIFVKMVGPGPFAGVLAIGVHQIGMLGKLFSEEMERIDDSSIEALLGVGANATQTMFYARIPQLMPIYSSHILNHFEIALRSASTLGLVGAGGIGAPLIFAIQARNWDRVSIILLSVVITVFLLDILTGYIRKKLR